MKKFSITRNGETFKLTKEELCQAHRAVEDERLTEDINTILESRNLNPKDKRFKDLLDECKKQISICDSLDETYLFCIEFAVDECLCIN